MQTVRVQIPLAAHLTCSVSLIPWTWASGTEVNKRLVTRWRAFVIWNARQAPVSYARASRFRTRRNIRNKKKQQHSVFEIRTVWFSFKFSVYGLSVRKIFVYGVSFGKCDVIFVDNCHCRVKEMMAEWPIRSWYSDFDWSLVQFRDFVGIHLSIIFYFYEIFGILCYYRH